VLHKIVVDQALFDLHALIVGQLLVRFVLNLSFILAKLNSVTQFLHEDSLMLKLLLIG